MKRIATTILLSITTGLLLSFTTQAQSNLEFGEVKYIKLSGNYSGGTGLIETKTITVPQGRVWKVVAASGSREITGHSYNYSPAFWAMVYIDDVRISSQPVIETSGQLEAPQRLPIWLSPGTYTLKLATSPQGNSGKVSGIFNAIEFIVTPK